MAYWKGRFWFRCLNVSKLHCTHSFGRIQSITNTTTLILITFLILIICF